MCSRGHLGTAAAGLNDEVRPACPHPKLGQRLAPGALEAWLLPPPPTAPAATRA